MFEVYRLSEINTENFIGQSVCIKALVSKVEVKPTRNGGSEYLNITLVDGSEKINCKKWNATNVDKSSFVSGAVYEMTISVESWEGNASCVLKGYTRLTESPMDYVEKIKDAEKYINLIKHTRESLTEGSVYSKIVNALITDDVIEKMSGHPAASGMHHNIIGGLLMHTATMAQCGHYLSQIYNLNRDLVESAILLHDFKKLEELSCNIETGDIKYTTRGSLEGHIVMMAIEIDKVANELGLQGTEEVELLKHCVLAHHGKREWGSPVEPAVREALLIHYIDGMDAEMYKLDKMIEHIEPGTTAYEHGKVVYREVGKTEED